MKVTPTFYAEALYQALQETKPSQQEEVLDNFVKVLADAGHLAMFAEIEAAFQQYERKQKGMVEANVLFAREHKTQKNILNELNNLLGKNVELKTKINSGIIGGVVIETEDERIDASVKSQLSQLKKFLIN